MATNIRTNRETEKLVINDLNKFEAKAHVLCLKLEKLQRELLTVNTPAQFDSVARQLINEWKNTRQFLSRVTNGADQQQISKIMAQVARDPNLKNLESLLMNLKGSTKDTISTKEKMNLPVKAKNFINALEEIKPVSELIVSQSEEFARRLDQASSFEEVEAIESEVLNRNSVLEGVLTRLLPYPEDESVAGELLDFLKTKKQLLDTLQSFNLYESLEEEIQNAKDKFQNASSLSPMSF